MFWLYVYREYLKAHGTPGGQVRWDDVGEMNKAWTQLSHRLTHTHTHTHTPYPPSSLLASMVFDYMALFFLAFFAIEFILRVVASRSQYYFWRDIYTWFDVIALAACIVEVSDGLGVAGYINTVGGGSSQGKDPNGAVAGQAYELVRNVLRSLSVFRAFKLTRQLAGTRILIDALNDSAKRLFIPGAFLIVLIFISGAFLYLAERGTYMPPQHGEEKGTYVDSNGSPSVFTDIIRSSYATVVTITSVGYGDLTPSTVQGKFVASVTMILGILYMSMPLSIVGGQFQIRYKETKKKLKDASTIWNDQAPAQESLTANAQVHGISSMEVRGMRHTCRPVCGGQGGLKRQVDK